jgi:predicted nucleic acid-binding Zn ribbon protein
MNAARKISAYKVEQDKAKAIMDKARQNRQDGRMAMPGALFLMLLGIVLALLTLYMLSSAGWPF